MIMLHIFKGNIQTWTEAIKIRTWVKRTCTMRLINVIRQEAFTDAKVMSLCKFHWLESTDVT